MKKLFGFLTNRWFLAAVGFAMLAIVIWLFGPLVKIGRFAPLDTNLECAVLFFAFVAVWAIKQVRKLLTANKANQGMVDGLVEADSDAMPDRSAEEVAALKERFEQAVEVLKKAKGKKRRLNLYDLPWYIIIGPPGSGKTTALVNSGLDFPLAEHFGREALSGVGGTRNCDWWFTDEAILLDTAGRYTTQDSDSEVDRSAWTGFLGLLKKYRRRRPINGVLVAISLLDLMTQNEHERAAHARAIKKRIQELDEFFKIRFPVYVVLTKTDLVAGFTEFFDDLGRNDREQVWGVTFPIEASESAAGVVDGVGKEFDALLDRLNARVLLRMSQERDPRRRAAIYGFPRQLASLKQNLEAFLSDVFRASRFDEAPMLRGVYMTSGTQEGAPIDRLMGMVARTFGLDQQVFASHGGQGRSYFIKSLLTDVVFREAEIAGTNRKLEWQRAWLQRGAYAACAAVVVLAVVGWTISYFNNLRLIDEAQAAAGEAVEAVERAAAGNLDVLSLLPALNAARSIPGGYADRDRGAPFGYGLGLYQGGKLGRQAEAGYRRVLREVLLPRLILRTERALRTGGASGEFQYEALKAYLMLDSRDHYDAPEVIAWFAEADFAMNLPRQATTADRDALTEHLTALFEEQPQPLPLPLDQNLIEQTQRTVARVPTETRIYSRLKTLSAGAGLPEFTIQRAAGQRAALVFSRKSGEPLTEGIDGLYTREGYRRYFVSESLATVADLLDERWILGEYAPDNLNAADVQARVRELYLDDFARLYEGLVLDIELAPFTTAQEASNILNELSRPNDSPLVLLLNAIAAETELENRVTSAIQRAGEEVTERARNLRDLFGGASEPNDEPRTVNRVEERFAWLHALLSGEDSAAPAVQHVLELIEGLGRFMSLVASQSSRGEIQDSLASEGQQVVQNVRDEANRQPPMIQLLLNEAAARSQGLAFGGVMAGINNAWRSEGLTYCRQAIAGRYPFTRSSNDDIPLDDFGTFFAPGGIVDRYFDDYLARYVDTSRSPWRTRSALAVPVHFSAASLAQFERANRIKQKFFQGGGNRPSVGFNLTPVDLDAGADQFTLEIEGQTVTYRHGPPRVRELEWPGPVPADGVRMEVVPRADGSLLLRDGEWAWFRVLDEAELVSTGRSEVFRAEFRLGDRTAVYDLEALSAFNPFDLDDLEEFSCPESL